MNKKIIIFPGQANNTFFLNELPAIKQYFSDIIVFSYHIKKSKVKTISNEHNIHIINIKSGIINAFRISFVSWLFSNEVRQEIRSIVLGKRSIFKKIAYMVHYGLFFSASNHKLNKEICKSQKTQQQVVLYSFWLSRGAYTISKISKHKHPNVSIIISRAHGYDLYEYRNQLNYLPFRKYINHNLDKISFISNDGLNYHASKYGLIDAKREISRLGTYPTTLSKKIVEKNYVTIASCSSIIQVKRLDLIIEVLSRVSVPIKWIHLGSGNLESEIICLAQEKLPKVDVRFLGNIENKNVLKVYIDNDVDYFINLSDSEGVPVSIMEALSVGIPVIARNVGGNNEIVSANNGLLLDKTEDINVYSELVFNELRVRLGDVNLYDKKCHSAKESWNNRYNSELNYYCFFENLSAFDINRSFIKPDHITI